MSLPAFEYVEIFPPIGIARVGDSPEEFFGPEVPNLEPVPPLDSDGNLKFKDTQHRIKRQAVRFRAYAFNAAGVPEFEVKEQNGFHLKWTVHVANKKGAWVNFRGRYENETWNLRNSHLQDWPADVEQTYAFPDTRTHFIIDSGPTSVEGANGSTVGLDGVFHRGLPTAADVHLGEIRTDNLGRLIVLAGDGHARDVRFPREQPQSLTDPFNSRHWYDTICDGSVTLSLTHNGVDVPVKHKATIITAPPRFVHSIECPTTLYDAIENIYEIQKRFTDPERTNRRADYDCGEVQYYRHIDPIFRGMYNISWTNRKANTGHGPLKANRLLNNESFQNPDSDPEERQAAFERIRAPVIIGDAANEVLRDSQANVRFMPILAGDGGDIPMTAAGPPRRDRWASLTELQYDRLRKWAMPGENRFKNDPLNYPTTLDEITNIKDRLAALTRAALQWSVGGPLYPGIEVYWKADEENMYQLDVPFRFNDSVQPGDLTRGLALPWQSDFWMCNTHWWPSIRPDQVVNENHFQAISAQFQENQSQIARRLIQRVDWASGLDEENDGTEMVNKWNKLGFVVRDPYNVGHAEWLDVFVERERSSDLPAR